MANKNHKSSLLRRAHGALLPPKSIGDSPQKSIGDSPQKSIGDSPQKSIGDSAKTSKTMSLRANGVLAKQSALVS